MADTKISAETPASALDGSEVLPVVQGGGNRKATTAQVKTYAQTGLATVATSGAYSDLSGRPSLAAVATSGSASDLGSGTLPAARLPGPSIQSVTSAATVTPTFSDDLVKITAQAAGLTLANPSGTAVPGWGIAIRIKDNGTARTISYGTQYRAIGVTLPTTTVIGKTLYLGCVWNADDTKLDVLAVAQEA
jgi:hypothetical protein